MRSETSNRGVFCILHVQGEFCFYQERDDAVYFAFRPDALIYAGAKAGGITLADDRGV